MNLTSEVADVPIMLVDGLYEADHRSAGLVLGSELQGDFDVDGWPDVMTLFWYSSGGSGTSLYLVWFPSLQSGAQSAAAYYLGDRIRVESMAALDDGVSAELRYLYAGEEDAMCCPGARRTIKLSLRSGKILETSRIEEGRVGLADLAGTTWRLTSYGVGEKLVSLDRALMDKAGDAEAFSLAFEEGRIFGMGSCNRFFATTNDTGALGLSIEALGSTKMFCVEEPYGLTEHEYLLALGGVEKWEISLGRLILYGPVGVGASTKMVFEVHAP